MPHHKVIDGCARGGRAHADETGPGDGALYGLYVPHLAQLPLVPPPLKPPVYEVRIHLVWSADRARCRFLD